MATIKKLKICSRGHKFYKSSDCPVCPKCWSGYYKNKKLSDFPEKISVPALRALLNNKIRKLSDLKKYTEEEIEKLHGMGPGALKMLKSSMRLSGVSFLKRKG